MAGPAAQCVAHAPCLSRLVSLRDFGRRLTHRGRMAVAVAERSEALGAAGEGPPPPPPLAAHDLLQQLTAQEREQVTHDVLRAFLAVESHSRGVQPDRQRRQRSPHRQRDAAGEGGRRRGLQGQVAEHLLSGGFDEALLESVPTHTLNWALKVLGQQGGVAQAEQLFHWMRLKGRANQHSFVKLCEACGAARQPWRALQAWRNTRRMPQAAAVAGTHAAAALVLCYRSTGDHRGAIAALEDLLQRRFPVNRYAYNAAIRVCADAGAADDALLLLSRLRQAAAAAGDGGGGGGSGIAAGGGAPGSGELRTDCFSYSGALAALAVTGRCNRGGQLHRWLAEDGLVPDAPLCAQLLSCYAAVGQAAAAQQLVDAMLAGPLPAPNRTHWNALLLAYAAAHDAQGCGVAYRRLLAAGLRPDGFTMLALLRAAFRCRHGLAGVRAVRREMRARCVPLNRQLGTAMLCCLRHVRPAAGPGLQLGHPDSEQQRQENRQSTAAQEGQQQKQQQQSAQEGRHQHQQQQQSAQGQQQQQQQQSVQGQQQQAAQGQQPAHGQQQHRQPPDEAAACLGEALSLFGELQRQAARQARPLDLRAWNSLLLVQLAAGDHAGVLATFDALEKEERLLPDGTTLGVAIAACRRAGWRQREAQLRQLLRSSALLGALGGDEAG